MQKAAIIIRPDYRFIIYYDDEEIKPCQNIDGSFYLLDLKTYGQTNFNRIDNSDVVTMAEDNKN